MCQTPSPQLFQLLKDMEKRVSDQQAAEKARILAANKEAAKNVLLGIQLQLARRSIQR